MTQLTTFLKKQKEMEKKTGVNLNKIKKEWLSAIDDLFGQIKRWVSEAQNEGLLEVTAKKISISEEKLGTYSAPMLVLRTERNTVELKPVGALILGAQGRVDMVSTSESFILLYLSSEKGWVYFNQSGQVRQQPLTESLFTELLKDMLL